jgi:hypothetical protein
MESEVMQGFVLRLDEINTLADRAEGFVWRLKDDGGSATAIRVFDDPLLLVNMSVWQNLEVLKQYVYKSLHVELIRDRAGWFNKMNELHQALWWVPAGHIPSVQEAKQKLDEVTIPNQSPTNLEEWILSQIGVELYEIFVKGYTTKQWGRDPKELPSSIIKRLPIRLTFDDNYYFDKYQGIPIGGYTQIFEKLLDGIDIKLNVDYLEYKDLWDSKAKKVVYTGPIDAFYDYKFGKFHTKGSHTYRTTGYP